MEGNSQFSMPELLVLLIQLVKEDPFEKLLDISTPVTMSLVNKYFLQDYETEDLTQEARTVLVKSVKKYDFNEGMCFLQFYHMSLTNHFNMLVRKQHAHKRKINRELYSLDQIIEEAGESIRGVSPVMTNPECVVIVKEAYEAYIIELSPLEREVLKNFINGVSIEEVSVLLGCTEEKIKNAWYRCGIKFKSLIN